MRLALPMIMVLALGGQFAHGQIPGSERRPLSLEVLNVVVQRNLLPPQELASWLQQRRVKFQVTPEIEAGLRASGADAMVLAAVRQNFTPGISRADSTSPPGRLTGADSTAQTPISYEELTALLKAATDFATVERLVVQRGVSFLLTPARAADLARLGVPKSLIGIVGLSLKGNTTLIYDELIDEALLALSAQAVTDCIQFLQQAISLDKSQSIGYVLLGYLQFHIRRDLGSAGPTLDAAFNNGGWLVFRMQHYHGLFHSSPCTGSLFWSKLGLVYRGDNGQHTFDYPKGNVRRLKLNSMDGIEVSGHLASGAEKKVDFIPLYYSRAMTILLLLFIEHDFGLK
jgi:hypothetical protein